MDAGTMEQVKLTINELFGNCLTPTEVCLIYAELYSYIREQMECCMNYLIENNEENKLR